MLHEIKNNQTCVYCGVIQRASSLTCHGIGNICMFCSNKLSVSISFIFSNMFPVDCLSLKGAKVLVIYSRVFHLLFSLKLCNIPITGYLLNHALSNCAIFKRSVISSLVYFLPVAFYIFSASCFLV